jgi:hypothetical protein
MLIVVAPLTDGSQTFRQAGGEDGAHDEVGYAGFGVERYIVTSNPVDVTVKAGRFQALLVFVMSKTPVLVKCGRGSVCVRVHPRRLAKSLQL